MITLEQLNALYIEKLQKSGSHDEAIMKVWWRAYQQGAKDAQKQEIKNETD